MDYDTLIKDLKEKSNDNSSKGPLEEWKVMFDDLDMAELLINCDGSFPYGTYLGVPICDLTFKGNFESVLLQFDKYYTEKHREFLIKKFGKEQIDFIESHPEIVKQQLNLDISCSTDPVIPKKIKKFPVQMTVMDYGHDTFLKYELEELKLIPSKIDSNEKFLELFTKKNKYMNIWFEKL